MMAAASFLQTLDGAANQAAAAETAYRREAADQIKRLERDRSFAFRRLSLIRAVMDAVSRAESEELAIAASLAILRAKLGWSSDSEARSATLTQFAPVAKAMFANLRPEPDSSVPDVLAPLAAFEAWYEDAYRTPFWSLFEQPILETPLVDF
jgi:hypothetical protein